MITLVSLPSRQFNNGTHTFGPSLLSQFTDVSTCGGILLRFEVESINAGASITIVYTIYNGSQFMYSSIETVTAIGKYQIGWGRGDMDNTTTVQANVTFTGRSRVNATLYSVAKGEDVPEWL